MRGSVTRSCVKPIVIYELGDRFVASVVFHSGPQLYELDQRIVAAPIAVIWGYARNAA